MVVYRWPDGRVVLICADVGGGTGDSGQNNSGPPWVTNDHGSQTAQDGRTFNWEVETTDGRNLKCRVNGKDFDPAKGTLFLVRTKKGQSEAEQVKEDLSAVQPTAESLKEFARKNAAVSKVLAK
jgi:hypothetical protein